MNYKRLLSACLLSICLGGVVIANTAYAVDEIKISYDKTYYPALNDAVAKRLPDDSVKIDIELLSKASQVTLSKNYPIVPYDPNHPNVKKQAQATINANTKTLAGRLSRGLNAAALTLAVADLIGEGVDWVLDPDNNSVRYKTDSSCYSVADYHRASESKRYSVPVSIDSAISDGQSCEITLRYHYPSGDSTFTFRAGLDTDNQLSLDTIAQHIINNDTVNNTTNNTDNSTTIINNYYGDAVTDTLIEQVNGGQHDEEFRRLLDKLNDETNSETDTTTETTGETDTETDSETKTDNNGAFEFPKFCDWAGVVCDWLEWAKEEPELEPEEVPQADIQLKDPSEFDKQHINAGNQCPPDVVKSFSTGFKTEEIRFEMMPICDFASTYIKPVIIFLAYIFAVISIGNAFKIG